MIKNIKELTDHFQDVFDEYVHQKSENPLKNHTIELIENPKFGKTRAPNFKGMEKQVENKLQTLKKKNHYKIATRQITSNLISSW